MSPRTKRLGGFLAVGFLSLNVLVYRQARALTHFGPPGPHVRFQSMSLASLLTAAVAGVPVPRPENHRTPADVGLDFKRAVFPGGRGIPLEAWVVPALPSRGTVVLFHGHAASKDSQLREARVFHEMGLNAVLVDFFGSGGSGGNETSIGFYEAQDVTKAYEYAQHLPDAGPIILFGSSMGAAAILKSVADDQLRPAGLILECPFYSLVGTIRHRFGAIPSFPLADLLVAWGGVAEGFNAFSFRPVDSAAHVASPALLMNGDSDPFVRRAEAQGIYDALRGPKTLKFFAGFGHGSCIRANSDEWKKAVSTFLFAIGLPPTG
jgi:alpha-beta hydrolase superfamily lysophospholipase